MKSKFFIFLYLITITFLITVNLKSMEIITTENSRIIKALKNGDAEKVARIHLFEEEELNGVSFHKFFTPDTSCYFCFHINSDPDSKFYLISDEQIYLTRLLETWGKRGVINITENAIKSWEAEGKLQIIDIPIILALYKQDTKEVKNLIGTKKANLYGFAFKKMQDSEQNDYLHFHIIANESINGIIKAPDLIEFLEYLWFSGEIIIEETL